jgi:hypothetical protein
MPFHSGTLIFPGPDGGSTSIGLGVCVSMKFIAKVLLGAALAIGLLLVPLASGLAAGATAGNGQAAQLGTQGNMNIGAMKYWIRNISGFIRETDVVDLPATVTIHPGETFVWGVKVKYVGRKGTTGIATLYDEDSDTMLEAVALNSGKWTIFKITKPDYHPSIGNHHYIVQVSGTQSHIEKELIVSVVAEV